MSNVKAVLVFPSGHAEHRRGVMLPLVALLLPVVLILMGFSVDLAHMQNTRMELRAATDAAARAGATALSQTDSMSEARTRAKQIARKNYVSGERLRLRNSDITIGHSEPDSTGRWVFTAGGTPPNAVQIEGKRTAGSLGGSVPLFFGALIGVSDFEPQLSATSSFLNVDICLVLDRSSSMKLAANSSQQGMSGSDPRFCRSPYDDSRWAALDSAVRVFIQTLNNSMAEEKVALATYSSDDLGGMCGASSTPSSLDAPLSTDLNTIAAEMDNRLNTVWNGNTHIEAGMRTGLDALTDPSTSRIYANKVMIVLTDGIENRGDSRLAAADCRAEQIVVHSITFGDYADQDRMVEVATIGGGRHYHASDSAQLEAIFRELAAEIAHLTE